MLDPGAHPRGLGTPDVESFTSAVRRLAEQESRTVEAFLDVRVVGPAAALGRRTPNFIATSLTEAVNGATPLTRVLVDELSNTLSLADLHHTTLLVTAGELFSRRDFSPVRRWCPLCLRDAPYDRLLWAFGEVQHCSRHRVALVSKPRCGHVHRPWALHANAQVCARCDCALADAEAVEVALDPLSAAYAAILTDLQHRVVITRASLTAGARALLQEEGLTAGGLAARTRLSRSAVTGLLAGNTSPELGTLARLVGRAGWSLASLLSRGAVDIAAAPRRWQRPVTARRDLAGLELTLRREGPKPRDARLTLEAIARDFGVSPRYPGSHFPALVEPWSNPSTRRRGRRPAA